MLIVAAKLLFLGYVKSRGGGKVGGGRKRGSHRREVLEDGEK